jgi:fluoride exporter
MKAPMNTRRVRASVSAGATERPPGTAAARVLLRLSLAQARIAAIMAGGAIGTLARAALAEALPHRAGQWPWATFGVNLAGAFILGWVLTRLAERTAPSSHWRFFAGTGFCGALTTFSTFQIETFEFARDGDVGLAVGYPVASIAAGMALAVAGVLIARWGRHW